MKNAARALAHIIATLAVLAFVLAAEPSLEHRGALAVFGLLGMAAMVYIAALHLIAWLGDEAREEDPGGRVDAVVTMRRCLETTACSVCGRAIPAGVTYAIDELKRPFCSGDHALRAWVDDERLG